MTDESRIFFLSFFLIGEESLGTRSNICQETKTLTALTASRKKQEKTWGWGTGFLRALFFCFPLYPTRRLLLLHVRFMCNNGTKPAPAWQIGD